MEPLGTRPPQLGTAFIKTQWTLHRLDAINAKPKRTDYEIADGDFLKCFEFDDINPSGISFFVPLGDSPHNTPISRKTDCYIIPKNTYLPVGLVLVFTNFMKLRFPSGTQNAWHFVITPSERMTLANYTNAIKNLNWELCEIKASGDLKELIRKDNDLRGVKDFRMNMLYWLIEIWYEQTDDAQDRLLANDIHTWVASKKPTFKDLICNKQRACIAFSAMARLDTISITQETYKYTILGDLEEIFGWKESHFIMDPKISDYHPENSESVLVDNAGVNVKNHGGKAKDNETIQKFWKERI